MPKNEKEKDAIRKNWVLRRVSAIDADPLPAEHENVLCRRNQGQFIVGAAGRP